MKIKKRDLLIILYLFSVMALFITYRFVVSPNLEQNKELAEENEKLSQTLQGLELEEQEIKHLETQIESMKDEIDADLLNYPADISEEEVVLYVEEVNEALNMSVTSVSFTKPTPVFSVVGEGSVENYNYILEQVVINVDYTTDYDGFKKIVDYINADKRHREITSVNVGVSEKELEGEFDEEGNPVKEQVLTGSFTITLYCIDGMLREPSEYDGSDINHGIGNIFD